MARLAITDADRGPDGRILVNPFEQEIARAMTDVGAPAPPRAEEPPAALRRTFGRIEIAGVVGGVLLMVTLIAALNAFWPAPAPRARPTAVSTVPAPTAAPTLAPTPPQQDAYAAPGGALLGTIPETATLAYQHSGQPDWAGVEWQGTIVWVQTDQDVAGLPDLAPPPTRAPRPPSAPASAPASAPVVVPANLPPAPAEPPCDPQINPRYTSPLLVDPIGSVVGASCESQAEADANAVKLAEAMRATADAAERSTP